MQINQKIFSKSAKKVYMQIYQIRTVKSNSIEAVSNNMPKKILSIGRVKNRERERRGIN